MGFTGAGHSGLVEPEVVLGSAPSGTKGGAAANYYFLCFLKIHGLSFGLSNVRKSFKMTVTTSKVKKTTTFLSFWLKMKLTQYLATTLSVHQTNSFSSTGVAFES